MHVVSAVVSGWGQVTKRKSSTSGESPTTPLKLMKEASQLAAEKMQNSNVLKNLDGIMTVKVLSTHYDSASKQLANLLGVSPRFTFDSGIGGIWPQTLVSKAANIIAQGKADTILITGAEAYYSNLLEHCKNKNKLFCGIPEKYNDDDILGSTEWEKKHCISMPIDGFSLFETALWFDSGLSLEEYLSTIGTVWAKVSMVAAKHDNAWFRTPRKIEDIISESRTNPIISFPYLKFMNPAVTVDMGAAVILMSKEKASYYNHAKSYTSPVYFIGGGYAEDKQRFLIEKTDFVSNVPIKIATQKALQKANLKLDDICCFDLYSCFPCAVSIAMKELGLTGEDKRPLTLTGGLGFFGGPGNNYSLHAIVTLVDLISRGERENGMITSLGWFMHKHSVGIYSERPSETNVKCFRKDREKTGR